MKKTRIFTKIPRKKKKWLRKTGGPLYWKDFSIWYTNRGMTIWMAKHKWWDA